MIGDVKGVAFLGSGKSAKSLLFALIRAFLLAMPVATMAPWTASRIAVPPCGATRHFSDAEGHFYWWFRKEQKAAWYLPDELRDPAGHRMVRVLRYVADEGPSLATHRENQPPGNMIPLA